MKKYIKPIISAAAGVLLIAQLLTACSSKEDKSGAQTSASTAVTMTAQGGSTNSANTSGTTSADTSATTAAPATDTPVTDTPVTNGTSAPETATSSETPSTAAPATAEPTVVTPTTVAPTTTQPNTPATTTRPVQTTTAPKPPVTHTPVTDDEDDGDDGNQTPMTPSQIYAELLSAEDVTMLVRFTQGSTTESVMVRKSGGRVRLNIDLTSRTAESYIDLDNRYEYTKKANGSWKKTAMSDPYTWAEALEAAFGGAEDYLAKDSNYSAYNEAKGRYEMTSSARRALGRAFEMEYTSVYLSYDKGVYTLRADERDPADDSFKMVIECVINFDPITVGLPRV